MLAMSLVQEQRIRGRSTSHYEEVSMKTVVLRLATACYGNVRRIYDVSVCPGPYLEAGYEASASLALEVYTT